jgi:hypothetical protein
MVALPNLNGIQPSYGGGDAGLPDGKYKTALVSVEKKDKHDQMGNLQSSYLELMHQVLEGPLTGQKQPDRLTLLHGSAEVVRIATQQLAAYTYVLNCVGAQDSQQLLNRPMMIEVGRQLDKTTKQPTAYGEVKRIFDVNGNEPGKAAQNSQPQQPTQPQGGFGAPAGGVQADGGGWNGGAPQGGQTAGGFQQQPQQGAPAGNWGSPAGGQPQQPQGQPQGGQAGGWQQGAGGQAGGNPAWGQR